MTDLYLRPNVKVEPLIAGWYAYPHLVSPVQCAMNLAFRILPVLESFIANPSDHEAAARNPAFLGGPFVSLGAENTDYAKSLVTRIRRDGAHLLLFANDYKAVDRRLQGVSGARCLDEFYEG